MIKAFTAGEGFTGDSVTHLEKEGHQFSKVLSEERGGEDAGRRVIKATQSWYQKPRKETVRERKER